MKNVFLDILMSFIILKHTYFVCNCVHIGNSLICYTETASTECDDTVSNVMVSDVVGIFNI